VITPLPDHYATLGLDRSCTDVQIRSAYRLLVKQLHPDVNHGAPDAIVQTQALNAAHEVLSDPEQRKRYDDQLDARKKQNTRNQKSRQNISQDVFLRIEECLRGTQISVRVNDPVNPGDAEQYELTVPPETAPGTRFRLPRADSPAGGIVLVRVKIRPDFRFKVRGSDLRCDLRVSFQRAAQGGTEMVATPSGRRVGVHIPRGVGRNEIIRVSGEGLPKARGGRGDLLVRVTYRPEVSFKRVK
jgi:DnaJ-class molecular chaperone